MSEDIRARLARASRQRALRRKHRPCAHCGSPTKVCPGCPRVVCVACTDQCPSCGAATDAVIRVQRERRSHPRPGPAMPAELRVWLSPWPPGGEYLGPAAETTNGHRLQFPRETWPTLEACMKALAGMGLVVKAASTLPKHYVPVVVIPEKVGK